MTQKSFAAVLTLSILTIGCGQDLPTSPSGSQHRLVVPQQTQSSNTRRRAAFSGSAGPCVDLSGIWDVRYQGSCPTDGYLSTWQLEQTGCSAHVNINPDLPTVSCAIAGSTVKVSMRNGFIDCTYQLEGTGTVSNGALTAVVSGPVGGPCCPGPNETVRLVATKR
jgi:hypothetical protein